MKEGLVAFLVVTTTEEFSPAFRRAVESGKPALIELRTNPDQITTRATIADLRSGKKAPKPAPKAKRVAAPAHRVSPAKKRG